MQLTCNRMCSDPRANSTSCAHRLRMPGSRPRATEANHSKLKYDIHSSCLQPQKGSVTSSAIMVIPPDPTGPGLLSVTLDMDVGEQKILIKNLQQVLSGLTDPAHPLKNILAEIALNRAASTSFTSSKQLNSSAGISTHQGDRNPQFANLSLDRGGSSGSSMLADSAATLKKGGSPDHPSRSKHHNQPVVRALSRFKRSLLLLLQHCIHNIKVRPGTQCQLHVGVPFCTRQHRRNKPTQEFME